MAKTKSSKESLGSQILKLANKWKNTIVKDARQFLGDKSKLISVSAKAYLDNKDKIVIEVTAGNKARSEYGDLKKVARAYEYGSGVHGKERRKYRIAPRRKKVLAFSWDKFDTNADVANSVYNSPKFVGITPNDRPMFRFVDHPGVAAVNNGRGYMRPAIEKTRRQIRKEISPEIRKAFIGAFQRSFKK